jgi:M6 family metalloprotease-like protein
MQRIFHFTGAAVLGRVFLALLVFHGAASAATLQDFGYQKSNVNGQLALGTRPLLLIVPNFAGETNTYGITNSDGTFAAAPLPHNALYYSNLVFNLSQYPSVNGYFAAMSNGRFSWTLAGVVSLNLPASQQDATWPGPGGANGHDQPYMSNLVYQAMASGQFNFKAFDANGDGHVTQDELGIIILGNDFTAERVTGGPVTSPDGSYDWGQGADAIGTSLVNNTPFITWCEEFQETLGITDIYGANFFSFSLSPQAGETSLQSFEGAGYWYLMYLDPWQRLAEGWCSPRIVSMATGGVVTISAAQAGDPTAPVILYDPAHGTSEFWMLEYRTQTSPYGPGYDANVAFAASGSSNGLAVWHIQQDTNHNLLKLASNSISGSYQFTDWNEGPPNLTWGASTLWGSGSVTPNLAWMNGDTSGTNSTPSATHLHVRPFHLGDGSITVDVLTAGDTWVDFNYTGSPQSGTFANPYNTIAAGISNATYGSTIHLKTGTSPEKPIITKLLNIIGYNGPAIIGQ